MTVEQSKSEFETLANDIGVVDAFVKYLHINYLHRILAYSPQRHTHNTPLINQTIANWSTVLNSLIKSSQPLPKYTNRRGFDEILRDTFEMHEQIPNNIYTTKLKGVHMALTEAIFDYNMSPDAQQKAIYNAMALQKYCIDLQNLRKQFARFYAYDTKMLGAFVLK